MKSFNNNAGKLEIILGCMFSGKSSMMLNKVRQHLILGEQVMLINHASDVRYAHGAITTHDKIQMGAICVESLMPIIDTTNYNQARIVCIEEAQFFVDLEEFVVKAVEDDHKHVILCGLDGDFHRKPFMNIISLIPMADVVEKLNALCIKCKDGTLASFSKRIIDNQERHLVGSNGMYIPVCRYHYKND